MKNPHNTGCGKDSPPKTRQAQASEWEGDAVTLVSVSQPWQLIFGSRTKLSFPVPYQGEFCFHAGVREQQMFNEQMNFHLHRWAPQLSIDILTAQSPGTQDPKDRSPNNL